MQWQAEDNRCSAYSPSLGVKAGISSLELSFFSGSHFYVDNIASGDESSAADVKRSSEVPRAISGYAKSDVGAYPGGDES